MILPVGTILVDFLADCILIKVFLWGDLIIGDLGYERCLVSSSGTI